jgi:hypothetical protein
MWSKATGQPPKEEPSPLQQIIGRSQSRSAPGPSTSIFGGGESSTASKPGGVQQWWGRTTGKPARVDPGQQIMVSVGLEQENPSMTQRAKSAAGVPGADTCCPNLDWSTRLQGCIGCFCVGAGVSLAGWIYLFQGDYTAFAIVYTIGNVVALSSSFFLWGPRRQWKKMWAAKRYIASGIYLGMMVLTLTLAFMRVDPLILLLCIVVQWCAAIWYLASYVPYGQKMIARFFGVSMGSK